MCIPSSPCSTKKLREHSHDRSVLMSVRFIRGYSPKLNLTHLGITHSRYVPKTPESQNWLLFRILVSYTSVCRRKGDRRIEFLVAEVKGPLRKVH